MSIFFATTALKKDNGLPDGVTADPVRVRKIGVLGAGFMGAGIATVAVQAGTIVRIKDASLDRVAAGLRAVHDVLRMRVTRRQLTRRQMDDTRSLVGGTIDYSGFANVDLVIEAVFEDLAVKHAVLREVQAVAPRAIFASNTSTIPIRDIATAAVHPDQVVGMHFFSPANVMKLLEIVRGKATAPDVLATAMAVGRQAKKVPVVVGVCHGFVGNRMLASRSTQAEPLLLETERLPCLATKPPPAATTKAAAVEILKVPLASPPVPQVSTRCGPLTPTCVASSRITSAAAAISSQRASASWGFRAGRPAWANQ